MSPIDRYDSHCHFSPRITEEVFTKEVVPHLMNQEWPINLMMTNHIDEPLVTTLVDMNPNVMANVGIHPWFTHLYTFEADISKEDHYHKVLEKYSKNWKYDHPITEFTRFLPDPIPIHATLKRFKATLLGCSFVNVGEIGIDKSARVPRCGFLGNTETGDIAGLSNYKVSMEHQLRVLLAILDIVAEVGVKSVSIHCVNAHGILYDVLKPLNFANKIPRIVMHSYSGSVEMAKMLLKLKNVDIWFGLSDYVNLGRSNIREIVFCTREKLLVETDLGVDTMGESHGKTIDLVVAKLEALGVDRNTLMDNWIRFNSH